ncbi:MAG: hypothetical protein LBS55_03415 [Prevotellaceae bacterium]|jgi:hypothetical protein|nr:hypothetical protein [Prevotellaceae bacterium]
MKTIKLILLMTLTFILISCVGGNPEYDIETQKFIFDGYTEAEMRIGLQLFLTPEAIDKTIEDKYANYELELGIETERAKKLQEAKLGELKKVVDMIKDDLNSKNNVGPDEETIGAADIMDEEDEEYLNNHIEDADDY